MSRKFILDGKSYVMERCYTCDTSHAFEEAVYIIAKQKAGTHQVYCPHGHVWVYKSPQKIREEEALRQERDRLKQQIAQKDDEINDAKRLAAAAKGQVTRLKNRAHAGLCPCCNRTFSNLQRHMASKHKDEVVQR